ncbi:hypothetical protein Lser_V15G40912 [Lactuca serriola]
MQNKDPHSLSFNLSSSMGSTTRIPILFLQDYEVRALHFEGYVISIEEHGSTIWQAMIHETFSYTTTRRVIKTQFDLPPYTFILVSVCTTTKEIWDMLKELYSRDADIEHSLQTTLLSEFGSFVQKPDEKLDQTFDRFNHLLSRILKYNLERRVIEHKVTFMNGLRSEWKVVVSIVKAHEQLVEKGNKATKGDSKSDLSYSEIYNEVDVLISNPKKFFKKHFSRDKNKYRQGGNSRFYSTVSTAHTSLLFMDSTTTTTTTTTTTNDPDTIFGDGRDIFEDFTYNPFRVQQESDEDDAPMTTEQFKAINTKLDSLLESTKAYSSNEYSPASIKAFLETLTKEHASNLALTNKHLRILKRLARKRPKKLINYFLISKALWKTFALHLNATQHLQTQLSIGGEAHKEVKKVSTEDVMKPVGAGDDQEQKPKLNEPKINVTLNSRGKEKLIDDSDVEEEDENEKLRRKLRCTKIDENLRIVKEVEEKERIAREAQLALEAQKLLFPIYSMERILNEAIDIKNIYWLEPVVSFKLENSLDSQLDLPITLKAFQFWCFDGVANVPFTDKGADQMLFSVNLKHMKPQYETWSSKKITVDEHKYETIVVHLKRVLIWYIQEVGKMDVEIATVLRKKPTVLPKEALENFDKMKLNRIRKDGWCVAFQIRERSDAEFHRVCFSLANKHL